MSICTDDYTGPMRVTTPCIFCYTHSCDLNILFQYDMDW